MFVKLVIFAVLLQVFLVHGARRVMIKNKKTGMVLDGQSLYVTIGPWAGKNSQLWVLKSSASPGAYIINNVENGKALDACPVTKQILTWPEHGGVNQRWNVNSDGTIVVLFYPSHVMAHTHTLLLDSSRYNDDSDKWLLVEPFNI